MPKTSEEEILKLSKKISKSHAKGDTSSMSEALSALRRLPMTVDILKSTASMKKSNFQSLNHREGLPMVQINFIFKSA